MRKLIFMLVALALVLSACQTASVEQLPSDVLATVIQPLTPVEVNGLKLEVRNVLTSPKMLDPNTGEISEAGSGQEWILVGVAVLDGNPSSAKWPEAGFGAPALFDHEGRLLAIARRVWVFRLEENDEGVKAALIFAFLAPEGSSGLIFRPRPGVYIDLTSLEE